LGETYQFFIRLEKITAKSQIIFANWSSTPFPSGARPMRNASSIPTMIYRAKLGATINRQRL